ncbi:hypothetical protein [Microbacterium bandirmense]|uniref:HNH endonuclease n=1 Tax=Microbacterium bandirmense TaxID=3122050 RepID=UPI003076BE1C
MSSTCVRGATNPTQATRYQLWADSAGYCSNPTCQNALFVDAGRALTTHFGEIAHIIAASPGGPRGDERVPVPDLGEWANLVLLCANCHTVVDKTPESHPVEMLLAWKQQRKAAVEAALGIAAYATREQARAAIEPFARQNRHIHQTIGPDNDYRFDPNAEEAAMWEREVVATIIPNLHHILRIIDANRELLTDDEKDVVAAFRSHIDGLTHRHLGAGGLRASRYPAGMEDLFA